MAGGREECNPWLLLRYFQRCNNLQNGVILHPHIPNRSLPRYLKRVLLETWGVTSCSKPSQMSSEPIGTRLNNRAGFKYLWPYSSRPCGNAAPSVLTFFLL